MGIAISYAMYLGAAALVGVLAVLLFGGALQLGQRRPDGYLVFFVAPLVAAIAAHTLASGRNLVLMDTLTMLEPPDPAGWAKWVQRAATVFFLAASAERLATFAFAPRQTADRPVGLMLAFAVCWVGMVALPAAFGARPGISHDYFYSLLIGLAALTTTEQGARTAIRLARDTLVCFVLGGLVLLAVQRDMVLGPYIGGLIPGFPWRYSGLASGPNALGPLCVLALLALRAVPYQRRWLNWGAVLAVLVSLFLSQSKTSWIAGLLCWSAMALATWQARPGGWLDDPRQRMAAQLWLVLGMAAAAGVLIMVVAGVGEGRIARFLATRAGADILTLTGRNEIWNVALKTFLENPWFGYGPSIWDPYFRFSIGIPAAFHAHNQFINVLAAAGVAGAVGFVLYLLVLFVRLWPRMQAFNGFALGLTVLILVRSFSEVPFNLYGFGGESLTQMLLLMALAGAPALARQRSAVATQPNTIAWHHAHGS